MKILNLAILAIAVLLSLLSAASATTQPGTYVQTYGFALINNGSRLADIKGFRGVVELPPKPWTSADYLSIISLEGFGTGFDEDTDANKIFELHFEIPVGGYGEVKVLHPRSDAPSGERSDARVSKTNSATSTSRFPDSYTLSTCHPRLSSSCKTSGRAS
jgi:hypothetical protein